MGVITDTRFLMGVAVGLGGLYVFHRFIKPVKGKDQAAG